MLPAAQSATIQWWCQADLDAAGTSCEGARLFATLTARGRAPACNEAAASAALPSHAQSRTSLEQSTHGRDAVEQSIREHEGRPCKGCKYSVIR